MLVFVCVCVCGFVCFFFDGSICMSCVEMFVCLYVCESVCFFFVFVSLMYFALIYGVQTVLIKWVGRVQVILFNPQHINIISKLQNNSLIALYIAL